MHRKGVCPWLSTLGLGLCSWGGEGRGALTCLSPGVPPASLYCSPELQTPPLGSGVARQGGHGTRLPGCLPATPVTRSRWPRRGSKEQQRPVSHLRSGATSGFCPPSYLSSILYAMRKQPSLLDEQQNVKMGILARIQQVPQSSEVSKHQAQSQQRWPSPEGAFLPPWGRCSPHTSSRERLSGAGRGRELLVVWGSQRTRGGPHLGTWRRRGPHCCFA